MADEATLQNGVETNLPLPMTKATGTAFEQGALVTLADNFTATAASADGYCGGIVQTEVTAAEASPSVSVYRDGIFRGTASAAITVGQTLAMTGGGNKLKPSTAADVGGKTVGIALESASGNGEIFTFELRPGVGVNAFA